MRALVVPNIEVITKEQLITELEADGVTIIDDSIPEIIWVEMANRAQFDKWLASDKVAGANSEDYEKTLKFDKNTSTSIDPNTSSTVSTSHHNWGLASMTQNSTTLSTTFTYKNNGANVDVVIMDTGIVTGHPEFRNQANTASRINQVNFGGTQGANFYTDPDGHGTHVAGTMAGRTQGWAREATIHSFTTNLGGLTHGYSPSSMGYLTSWHNAKSNNKPTIVNMSWATSTYYPPNHPGHTISIASWDPSNIPSSQYHMTRSSSYDTLVKNMHNAGIVTVCSAGNDNERVYDSTEGGWNSGYWYFFDSNNDIGYGAGTKMYMQDASAHDPNVHGTGARSGIAGAPPGGSFGNTIYFQATNNGQSPGNAWIESGTSTRHDIAVQAHDHNLAKASYSNYGAPLRIWAPGSRIHSAYINSGSAVQIGSTGYYVNKLNGTSMASPQVAGLVACFFDRDATTYAGVTTKANQESAIAWLEGNGDIDGAITDWGGGMTNLNRAYQPYQDYNFTWQTGNGIGGTYAVATVNENNNLSYDLSATVRNSASEQLHTATFSIQSGSLPSSVTLNNSTGVISGTPGPTTGGQTYTFVVRVDNGFEYQDKSYSLTVNDSVTNITISGGITIGAGISLG
mgnify:CR=1 FL=1